MATPKTSATAPKARAPRKAPATKTAAKSTAPRTAAKPRARAAAAKAPVVRSTALWSIGAVVVAAGAGLAAFLNRGRIAAAAATATDSVARATGHAEGHVPTDLLDPERNADDRAVADFRPNMDAVMTAAEREALRPPVGKPSMTASNGSMNAIDAPLN